MATLFKAPEPRDTDTVPNLVVAVFVGITTATTFAIGGFFLVARSSSGWMGSVLFLLVPASAGFATALMVRGKQLVIASLCLAFVLSSSVLLFTGMEGWVCVLMSAPLVVFGLTIGALIGTLFRHFVIDRLQRRHLGSFLTLSVLPFFLIGANRAEEKSRGVPRVETFTDVLVTDASRERVWNQLKTFDRIEGNKGLLMKIGLPVPVSCTMSGEGVGATRTCYFEHGHIEERVTEWNPPSSMKLEITAFDVPGRPWLSFKDASYDLTTENGRTVVTRATTVVSRLSPAWYWRPMEKIGVETEHEYLFAEVKRKIEGAK